MTSTMTDNVFKVEAVVDAEPPLGGVRVWRDAFRWSFERLNRRSSVTIMLLDSGGGTGSLYSYVDPRTKYVLLDLDAGRVGMADVPVKVVADATRTPFPDESFDMVLSISTLQYLEHRAFMHECWRVLRPGGILAQHENGSYNPFILAARAVSRLLALGRPGLRAYNSTILQYCDLPLTEDDDFTIVCSRHYGLLSPLAFILEVLGAPKVAASLAPLLLKCDQRLMSYKCLRKLAWFRVFHLEKGMSA